MSRIVREQCYSLWNSDLRTMRRHPVVGKRFLYMGCKILEVAVFGVVTRVKKMKNVLTYHIDDGTGVILCALPESYAALHKKEILDVLDSYRNSLTIGSHSNLALVPMLERAVDTFDGAYNFQLGDSVYLVGKISQCAENLRVVTVSFICLIEEFRSELLLMEHRSHFYKEILNNKDKEANKRKCSVNKNICIGNDRFNKNDRDDKSDKERPGQSAVLEGEDNLKHD